MVNLKPFYLATLHLNDRVDGLDNVSISEYVKTLNVCMDPQTADVISTELLASNHILCTKKGSRFRARRFRVPVVDKNIVVMPVNIDLEVLRILRRHANVTGLETEILLGLLKSEGVFTTKKALEQILDRLRSTRFITGKKSFKCSPQLLKLTIPSNQYVTFSWSKTGVRSLNCRFPVFRRNENDRSGNVSNVPTSEDQLSVPSLPSIRALPRTPNPLDVHPSLRDAIEMEDEAPAESNLHSLGNVRSGHFSVLDSEERSAFSPSISRRHPGPSVNVLHTRRDETQDDDPAQTGVKDSEMQPEFEQSDYIRELFDSRKLACIQGVCSFLDKLRLR